jgi:uncharacterized membrane protein YccC
MPQATDRAAGHERLRSRIAGWRPDLVAARSALRAAVVATALFAFGDVVVDNGNVALFGFFGTFALLVFVEFTGPAPLRLRAYLGLAAVGFPLIALGTVLSHHPWLAGAAMALLAFAILFGGVIGGYVAAAANPALLVFVVPVMVEAPNVEIPDRLAGWALACALAIPAAMLVWPAKPQRPLRSGVAQACRAIAACLELEPGARSEVVSRRVDEALATIREARRRYSSTPYRPTGATGRTASLARLVNDVAWIAPVAVGPPSQLEAAPSLPETREVKAASRQVLEATASLLDEDRAEPDLARLVSAREAIGAAFTRALESTGDDLARAFDEAFRLRFLSTAVLEIGAQGMLAEGRRPPELETYPMTWYSGAPRERSTPRAIARLLRGYASPNAVWFRNSVRGAVAMGLAVLLGLLIDLQHGFWVVLATLSVLRSNALNTGSTILRALAGTVVGIVVGGAILYAVGTDTGVLWAILPVTVLIAAYAPRAISFAAGQAAFTVAVLTLFNLLAPAGWQVGLVRIEDIAIGCAISLGVGVLFWPRGAAGVVRERIGSACARGIDYVARNVDAELGATTPEEIDRAAREAEAELLRLDDAFRQYLAERSTAPLDFDSLGVLVAGATRLVRVARVQRSGRTLFKLEDVSTSEVSPELQVALRTLEGEGEQLREWYRDLGRAVAAVAAPPEPLEPGTRTERPVLEWAAANAALPQRRLSRGLSIAWSDKLLDTLRRVQPSMSAAAERIRG